MKKIELSNLEAINTFYWYNQLTPEKIEAIPIKVRFALKRAMAKIMPDVKEFETFRDDEVKKFHDSYSTDEKSYGAIEPILDNDGNTIKDENGVEQTQTVRKVRDEYLEDFKAEGHKLDEKLTEILKETNVYEYNSADIDGMVENLPDDTPLEWNDINILDALLTDNGEA